jgi:hypothetical protein
MPSVSGLAALRCRAQTGKWASFFRSPRDLQCTRTFDSQALANVLRPVGQFNRFEIEVQGGDMTISINGAVVSTVRDCELTAGPIGIQSEGAETHWKNIRIREK